MIPIKLIEALNRWPVGKGAAQRPTMTIEAGKEMAVAIMTLLVWNSSQS